MTRTILLAILFTVSGFLSTGGQAAPPPKPKVISTPPPKAALPTDATPTTAPRKRPAQKSSATLIAEYTKTVKGKLGAHWQEVAPAKISEFTSGSLSITFKVDAEGKVVEFALKANTSNEALADFCEQVVRGTVFDKPPARALTNGQLEIPFNFTVY